MSENSGERCGGPPAWSARVPQDPLPQALTNKQQADVGVGRGPGGPPHFVFVHPRLSQNQTDPPRVVICNRVMRFNAPI